MKQKIFLPIRIVLFSAVIFSGCIPSIQESPATPVQEMQVEQQQVKTEEQEQTSIVLTAQEDGQTAFELLQKNHEVVAKEYDFGVFIESVDSLTGSDKYYWALYVNEEYAQQGADQTVLQAGDAVEFRYEEVTY